MNVQKGFFHAGVLRPSGLAWIGFAAVACSAPSDPSGHGPTGTGGSTSSISSTSSTSSSSSSSGQAGTGGAGPTCGNLGDACCSGQSCLGGYICKEGFCGCSGQNGQPCSGVCRDLAEDNQNCGACGTVCNSAIGEVCSDGTCKNKEWGGWPMPNPPSTGLPNPASYTVDENNGLVVDDVTHLMWQRDVDLTKYTWDKAKNHCANLKYGGYSDWRLPGRIELVSLIDFTKHQPGPMIDIAAFPNSPNVPFWTSSTSAGFSPYAVNFGHGNVFPQFYDPSDGFPPPEHAVRCVR